MGNCSEFTELEAIINDYDQEMDHQWYQEVGEICFLINSLHITLYQIRLIELVIYENEEEIVPIGVKIYGKQTLDAALVDKKLLIDRINRLLFNLPFTSKYSLVEDPDELYRVYVEGGIEDKVKVENIGYGTFEELKVQTKNTSYTQGVSILVSQRDFGEMLTERDELIIKKGEMLVAKNVLGRIFWPFLIDFDATPMVINSPLSNVVEVDLTEK